MSEAGGAYVPREWPPLRIGDAVLDGERVAWRVLNRPDGSEHADGLFQVMDGEGCRQRYGEHMKRPVIAWHGAPPAAAPSEPTP